MAKKPSAAPKPAAPDPAEEGEADPLMMVPLELLASPEGAEEDDFLPADEEIDAPEDEDEIVVTAARRGIADEAAALMGDEMDADGVAADVVDAGNELLLWALSPSPERVAVIPDIDMSDPEEWLDALNELDLPGDVEAAIEQLARAAAGGDGAAQRRFVAELGQLLTQAGIETLAVRKDNEGGVYDWVALSTEDIARERDGEPWAPAGDDDGLTFRPIGLSLGMGGRLSLWPQGAGPAPETPPLAAAVEEPANG